MREYPSLIGNRYGKLTVIDRAESAADGQRRWLCRCDCGGSHIVTTYNLTSGRTTNCGCRKSPDLTGKVFGRLTVLGRSEKRSPRGARTTPMWQCRCECGEITYKATDTLTNPDTSMCQACAGKENALVARAAAGYVAGTQLSKIRSTGATAENSSGYRGVYYDGKSNRYRVRLKFRGKTVNLGYFDQLEDAIQARQRAEEEIFGAFLQTLEETKSAII